MTPADTVNTVCGYCGVGCGMVLHLETPTGSTLPMITKSTGQLDHPTNFGRLCTKGSTTATTRTRSNPASGIGSRSIRHSSGRSTSARRTFHGWNSTVDICSGWCGTSKGPRNCETKVGDRAGAAGCLHR